MDYITNRGPGRGCVWHLMLRWTMQGLVIHIWNMLTDYRLHKGDVCTYTH